MRPGGAYANKDRWFRYACHLLQMKGRVAQVEDIVVHEEHVGAVLGLRCWLNALVVQMM
jgi:hypothetical protein